MTRPGPEVGHIFAGKDPARGHSMTQVHEIRPAAAGSATEGIMMVDSESTRLVGVSPPLCGLLGYSAEQLLARRVVDLHPVVAHPRLREELEHVARGRTVEGRELPFQRQNGSVFLADVTASPVQLGDRVHLVRVVREVTARLRQAQLERQRAAARRIESVGQLASRVAHEINNPLAGILTFAEELRADLEPAAARERADLDTIIGETLRCRDIVRRLLAFAHEHPVAMRPTDLNALVERVTHLLERQQALGGVALVRRLEPGLPLVQLDVDQFHQVIANLVMNAAQAMPQGGVITVETTAAADGSAVVLGVTDTGPGVPPELREHLFEPFFTTKATGKGLGLATVLGIVEQSGGYVDSDSAPGRGATFRVYLPCAMTSPSRWRGAAPGACLRGSETVLVVEPEPTVRELAARMLSGLGYQVHTADGLPAALDVAASTPAIQLVLTDVVMPDDSGPGVAAAVRTTHPTAKVLYMSSYTDSTIGLASVLNARPGYLAKPFTAQSLGRKVRELLDAGPEAR